MPGFDTDMMNRPKGQRVVTLPMMLFGSAMLTVLALLAIAFFGHVDGTEFQPSDFARRRYSFFQVPIVSWQILPTSRFPIQSDLVAHLRTSGWLKPVPNLPWDPVEATEAATFRIGDAQILCHFLDARDQNSDLIWLMWSKEHPDLAKVLWPRIQQLAIADLYFLVPGVFELAAAASDATQYEQELSQWLSRQLADVADAYLEFGDPMQAQAALDLALREDPDNLELRRRRAEVQNP